MRTKASLLGRSGGLHLSNVTMRMRMRVVEVMLWRDSGEPSCFSHNNNSRLTSTEVRMKRHCSSSCSS